MVKRHFSVQHIQVLLISLKKVLLQQASLLQLAMVSINPLTQVKLQSLLIQQ